MKHEQLMWLTHTDEELIQLCYEYGIEDECQLNMSMLAGSNIIKLRNRDHVETVLTSFEYDMTYAGA